MLTFKVILHWLCLTMVLTVTIPYHERPTMGDWLEVPLSWSKRTLEQQYDSAATMPAIHLSHRHLCEARKMDVTLNPEDDENEYMPRVYSEIRCKNRLINNINVFVDRTNGKCGELGMECVQQYRLMTVMQRRKDDPNSCWQPANFEIVVPYGCECMNPQQDKFNRNL